MISLVFIMSYNGKKMQQQENLRYAYYQHHGITKYNGLYSDHHRNNINSGHSRSHLNGGQVYSEYTRNGNQDFNGPVRPSYSRQGISNRPHHGAHPYKGKNFAFHQLSNFQFKLEMSKELGRILRHGKYKQIKLDAEGFCYVDSVIKCRLFQSKFGIVDIETIKQIVDDDSKKRFVLKHKNGRKWKIAATQGHTIKVKNLDLKPLDLKDVSKYPVVVHGTYYQYWESIKQNGLNRMNRTHIHFAVGMPGNRNAVSGMRWDSEVVIKINLAKAIAGGLEFFVSLNNVVLCKGDRDGVIHTQFFESVTDRTTNELLDFETSVELKATKLAFTSSSDPIDLEYDAGGSEIFSRSQRGIKNPGSLVDYLISDDEFDCSEVDQGFQQIKKVGGCLSSPDNCKTSKKRTKKKKNKKKKWRKNGRT